MHIIFVEPAFPSYQRDFVRGLQAAGARVTGIGEYPLEALDPELRGWLYKYEQISSVVNEDALYHVVRGIQNREWVDRMEATIEAHILPAAHVRERCGIPGTSTTTAFLCRDKPAMKDALRDAGVPCAQSTGTESPDELRSFARSVGFPLILKPRAAAGAAGTFRIEDTAELEEAIGKLGIGSGASVAAEEFIEGHEAFYDTIAIGGAVAHDFVCHYYPGVLEAMRTRWISPIFMTTNRIDTGPDYSEVREMGAKVIETLGIGTSATHMEWFFGPKGLKFSEIGCRPPGVGAWDLYSAANDFDIYTEWAMAVLHRRTSQTLSRRYSAGIVNLRPDRDGRIAGYEGLDGILQEFGNWILDSHIPPAGTPTQPVDAGFMANAWVRMRHPDYDHLHWMLGQVGERVQVRAV